MFYQENCDPIFRFGDVIEGFTIAEPEFMLKKPQEPFRIAVKQYKYYVILTPCCSIADRQMLISPLIQLRPSFFDNPYFIEDMTRINRMMMPQQTVKPELWEKFPEEEKAKRQKVGLSYALLECFVYPPCDGFDKYSLNRKGEENIETQHYMVDFRETHKIYCDAIIKPENCPISRKKYQMTTESRAELRDKLVGFYSRVPAEDRVEME